MDDTIGLVKQLWSDVRDEVAKVEPTFARIVDDIHPDNRFPVYSARYPYGAVIADPSQMYLPNSKKETFSLNDHDAPRELMADLAYGKDSWAMGMVLEKNIEVFIDFKDDYRSIPWLIYQPGTFFPFAKTLSQKSNRIFAPNSILTVVSGARSTFMLPNIGCLTNHVNLQKDYHVQLSPPKMLYEHWNIFKELVNSDAINSKWRSKLLYFSQPWLHHLHTDKAWINLKMYLHELAWQHFDYRRNHIYYDIAFSKIQQKRNLKPNPYLIDTASHLFTTALGAAPGYAPACNNDSLPVEELQEAYIQSYGMKKYFPTIMEPTHFNLDKPSTIYYSLQNPTTFVFSPKSRKISSTLFEMHELEYLMKILLKELSKDQNMCSGTVMSEMTKKIQFTYYHNEIDQHRIIKPSAEIYKEDIRFSYTRKKLKGMQFSADAKFLRGCIGIQNIF